MKKIFVMALAVLLVLGLSGMAMAALPQVHTTVNFEGANPDITVMSQATLKAGYSDFRETSVFTLTGTGDAVGAITASTGTYHCCHTLPKAELIGTYTASDGDFQSMFESSNLNWKSNPYSGTVPEFDSATFYSQHNLSATGVTSMTVTGGASAKSGWGQPLSAGQSFSGTALTVEVSAYNVRQEMDVDPVSLWPNLDAAGDFVFLLLPSDMVTVEVEGSSQGTNPINFGGQTGGEYRTYTAPGNNSSFRSSSLDYYVWLQKPTYSVYPNPLAADLDVYAPDASSMTIHAYTTTLPKPEVWGDAGCSY